MKHKRIEHNNVNCYDGCTCDDNPPPLWAYVLFILLGALVIYLGA